MPPENNELDDLPKLRRTLAALRAAFDTENAALTRRIDEAFRECGQSTQFVEAGRIVELLTLQVARLTSLDTMLSVVAEELESIADEVLGAAAD